MTDDKVADAIEDDETKWSYKEWYGRNKARIAARRKARYHSDKKHRQKVLDQNREYRASKAKERISDPKPKVKLPKSRKPVEMVVDVGGVSETISLVHIGTFARTVNRSVPTLHQWERVGLLPRTPYLLGTDNKQERLYTEEMIDVVQEALSTRGPSISSLDHAFRKEIADGWEAIGIVVGDEE